jgi:hypothetical protein
MCPLDRGQVEVVLWTISYIAKGEKLLTDLPSLLTTRLALTLPAPELARADEPAPKRYKPPRQGGNRRLVQPGAT